MSLTQSAERNKQVVRRHFEEVLNAGRLEVVDELYAPTYVLDAPVRTDGSADATLTRGREGLKNRVAMFRAGFPDIHFTLDDVMAEGDLVAVRYTFAGTHDGSFGGLAATGRSIRVPGILMARLKDGLIEEAWSGFDGGGMMAELRG
ncbi:ester cyclase [Deinococcus yavapaiensis]|uniref:Steroid delta-isomerase-like uncharacterized protein n=1 Tax=Deinococcus yavapaiensis KR-236 TaxID=694435 RepID=A0A318S5Q6_9DEIO|nr:ester cyclase [Deinococcus yavapaiensis]PYE53895.1 steroid delta-isomerase-like uncharacterized protein [Deinococcus yavapaiensis KR-236]